MAMQFVLVFHYVSDQGVRMDAGRGPAQGTLLFHFKGSCHGPGLRGSTRYRNHVSEWTVGIRLPLAFFAGIRADLLLPLRDSPGGEFNVSRVSVRSIVALHGRALHWSDDSRRGARLWPSKTLVGIFSGTRCSGQATLPYFSRPRFVRWFRARS
jgi:hypothetical protein